MSVTGNAFKLALVPRGNPRGDLGVQRLSHARRRVPAVDAQSGCRNKEGLKAAVRSLHDRVRPPLLLTPTEGCVAVETSRYPVLVVGHAFKPDRSPYLAIAAPSSSGETVSQASLHQARLTLSQFGR